MPGSVIGVIGHPVTAAVVSAVFLGAIVLHATVIWTDPFLQALAGGVALLTAGLIDLDPARARPSAAAISIEIRDAERGASVDPAYSVVVAGRPGVADVRARDGRRRQPGDGDRRRAAGGGTSGGDVHAGVDPAPMTSASGRIASRLTATRCPTGGQRRGRRHDRPRPGARPRRDEARRRRRSAPLTVTFRPATDAPDR